MKQLKVIETSSDYPKYFVQDRGERTAAIFDKLIELAARKCDSYASDIFWDMKDFYDAIQDHREYEKYIFFNQNSVNSVSRRTLEKMNQQDFMNKEVWQLTAKLVKNEYGIVENQSTLQKVYLMIEDIPDKEKVTLIDTDEEGYEIYEVETDSISRIKILCEEDPKYFEVDHPVITAAQCSREEQVIAKYLFRFLWDSDNGCTTYASISNMIEYLEERNIYLNETDIIYGLESFGEYIDNYRDRIDFIAEGVLEYEESEHEIGIFYDFLEYFDTKSFKMFED